MSAIMKTARRAGRGVLLLLLPMGVLADWSGFNRYGAIAEMQIDDGRAAVDLRVTEKAWTKLLPAGPSSGTPPEQAAMGLVTVKCPTSTPLAPAFGGVQHVEAAAPSTEAYYQVTWKYPLGNCGGPVALQARDGLAKDDLGLIVLHRGVPVSDLIALEKPLTLALDPADPWLSRFDDPTLIRRHAEPRSYVYVEPYEVRHEVLIRLADLLGDIEPTRKNPPRVAASERPELKQKIGQYLLGKNPLTINGEPLKPLLDRVEFVRFTRSGMVPVDEGQDLDVAGTLVGAVIVYLTEQPAQSLALRWELFGPQSSSRAVSVILGKESFDGAMTRAEPGFNWSREEMLDPAPAAESADGSPAAEAIELTDANLPSVLQALLHNAYRAFQLRDEEAVYDRLAKSLEDPLLENIYLQQRRSQIQQAKGLGGEGRVERIEILDAKRMDRADGNWWSTLAGTTGTANRDVAIQAHWKALGEVSHWGHSHKRENLYGARLTLHRDVSGVWKIAALHFLDGQRLEQVASR